MAVFSACCKIPPVVSQGYKTKGTYEELGGMKTYVTGPALATRGIISLFDIFGYFEQTLQGADILSSCEAAPYRVFMPDWFVGSPAHISWYPPDTEAKKENLSGFIQRHPPGDVVAKLPGYVKAVQGKYPEITSWGVVGYCWGGKVVSLVTASAENPFCVGAELHPAFISPDDAPGIKVPVVVLASMDESAKDVNAFGQKLTVPHHVEIFKDQVHGWMAARADLANDRVKEEYTRGYKTVMDFFCQHWKA